MDLAASLKNPLQSELLHRTLEHSCRSLLKQKLSELAGYPVISIQTDYGMEIGEIVELIHFECDLELKFSRD